LRNAGTHLTRTNDAYGFDRNTHRLLTPRIGPVIDARLA
jgi:hypothetical protein